jgi:hypothetical protein
MMCNIMGRVLLLLQLPLPWWTKLAWSWIDVRAARSRKKIIYGTKLKKYDILFIYRTVYPIIFPLDGGSQIHFLSLVSQNGGEKTPNLNSLKNKMVVFPSSGWRGIPQRERTNVRSSNVSELVCIYDAFQPSTYRLLA